MQHLRKIVYVLIAVVFVTAVAIGFGVMFSVKNVNVTLLSYVYDEDDEFAAVKISEIKENIISHCGGGLLFSVGEEKVRDAVDNGTYSLDKIEKIYPCTLNVTIRERKETFAVRRGEEYGIYDENGKYMKSSENYLNAHDNAPDVLLEGVECDEDIEALANVSAAFGTKFMSLRSVLESVALSGSSALSGKDRVIFRLRCGVEIELQNYKNMTKEKISAVYTLYDGLSGEQKLGGKIYGYTIADGSVAATYDKNG